MILLLLFMYIQDLAGVAHDDIDPSVFSNSGDEQMVRCLYNIQSFWLHFHECFLFYIRKVFPRPCLLF